MKILQPTERHGRRAEPTPDDRWCILVFGTGPDKDRATIVGPYIGLTRPQEDRETWILKGLQCAVVRMVDPATFESALEEDDLELFGYAASISDRDLTRSKKTPPCGRRR